MESGQLSAAVSALKEKGIGWGKAAQIVAVDGEIRQLVEVKLSVVSAAPTSHVLPSERQLELDSKKIKDLDGGA